MKIDVKVFHERLGQLVSTWKTDKRTGGDAVFGGVGSIVILLGKAEDSLYQKNNAMHVRRSHSFTVAFPLTFPCS